MHADDAEHGFAVLGVAWEGPQAFGDAGGLRVGVAAHQSRDGAGHVASGIGIVRKRERHQQRAEVGVSEAQRTEVVGILGNARGGISGIVNQNFLRGDGDIHGVAESVDIEYSMRSEELHQVDRRQVAGGVVEEHVLRARI